MSILGKKAAIADIFDRYREFFPWVSLDGFTVGGDTGYVVNACFYARLATGAVADYDAFLQSNSQCVLIGEAGKSVTVEIPLLYLFAITDQNIWLRMATGVADPPSETVNHFGFKIIGADLYASNADGTTQKITDTGVDLVAGWVRKRLKMIFTRGTDIKYYVDDVLKVTHTDNLPDAASFNFHAHIRTLAAAIKDVRFGRLLIEKVY